MHGTRYDIVFTSSLEMVINWEINIEFMDYFLIFPKEDIHLLKKNMFVLLSLVEMVGQCRILAMFCISCMVLLRWLSGNTHNLRGYNWGAVCMGRALGIFQKIVLTIIEHSVLVVCDMDMMSIFGELLENFPPFKEWWYYT